MEAVKSRPKLPDLTYDDLAKVRNQISFKIEEVEKAVKELKVKRDKVDTEFLRRFNEQGIQTVRTNHGTPYIIERTSCSAEDKDIFLSWIQKNDSWDFLEVRPKKAMVEEYVRENGTLPPGLSWNAKNCIGLVGKKA